MPEGDWASPEEFVIRIALKSFTFVKVGPVTTESPRASKKP
jgi:hypothetical protein